MEETVFPCRSDGTKYDFSGGVCVFGLWICVEMISCFLNNKIGKKKEVCLYRNSCHSQGNVLLLFELD